MRRKKRWERRRGRRPRWAGNRRNETPLFCYLINTSLIILYLEPQGKVSTWVFHKYIIYRRRYRACFIFHDQFTLERFHVWELYFDKSVLYFNWRVLSEVRPPWWINRRYSLESVTASTEPTAWLSKPSLSLLTLYLLLLFHPPGVASILLLSLLSAGSDPLSIHALCLGAVALTGCLPSTSFNSSNLL